MPTETNISWTDFSSNPLKYRDASGKVVWGCVKVSSGCAHCYSEALAKRWGKGGAFTAENMRGLTPFVDEKEVLALLNSKKISGKRVFMFDMTDWLGEWVPDVMVRNFLFIFRERHDVTFQVLTKRPERMTELEFPPNVWVGTSCENQDQADKRVPYLLRCGAAVRFVSVEPLLGPVTLFSPFTGHLWNTSGNIANPGRIDWVIIGGESGPLARPMENQWALDLAKQCAGANECAVFFKQASGAYPGTKSGIDELDSLKEFPA